jgi:hypothetical protein
MSWDDHLSLAAAVVAVHLGDIFAFFKAVLGLILQSPRQDCS